MGPTHDRRGRRSSGVAVLAVLAIGGQLYGLYRVPGPPSPAWFPHVDKVQHTVGFALPVALVLLALGLRADARGTPMTGRTVTAVLGAFAAHAVVSELVQHTFYTTRTGDPFDVLADWVGVAAGGAAGLALLRSTPAGGRPR